MKPLAWFFLVSLISTVTFSFAGEPQGQYLPNSQASTPLGTNTFVTVSGKKMPTRLWSLVNSEKYKQNPGDWDFFKNGTIS
ncbi:hypothetical protein SFSGTM_12720 [Sulfuriferula nivalis]|uniref:Uncharacterized protein n=1 Tax=Sulfuriferula nivalis TaxID=2675298 RepID=A0A809RI94_9PROT|nr:hypothetical protein SFSGTM_12720 [Sulfuriferula nivalis]